MRIDTIALAPDEAADAIVRKLTEMGLLVEENLLGGVKTTRFAISA